MESNAFIYASKIAYASWETLKLTQSIAKTQRSLDGCFVECGVAAGAQIIVMADAAPEKKIYAFDSFQGIPLPSNKDNQYPGLRFITEEEQKSLPDFDKQVLETSGATAVSEDDFWVHMGASGVQTRNIIAVPGWFQNTVKTFKHPISLLRLDGDLYASTHVCLEYLYPQVVRGGVLIIDDWDLPGCRQAVFDYFGEAQINWHYSRSNGSTIAYHFKK